eukprot:4068192-Alexandrium_andersonii.AAC.1
MRPGPRRCKTARPALLSASRTRSSRWQDASSQRLWAQTPEMAPRWTPPSSASAVSGPPVSASWPWH